MVTSMPPVVSGGLPILGHVLEMLNNREALFKRGYDEHGNLFSIKLGPQYGVVVTGSEYNRLTYMQTDKSLNMQDAYDGLRAAFGEVLFLAGKEKYYNDRPAIQEVFRRHRMVNYIDAMNIETQGWLDELGKSGEVNITEAMFDLAQYIAGRAFIGDDYERELGNDFWHHYEAISRSIDMVLPANLPLPKNWARDRARKKIHARITEIIQKRRDNPDQYDDLITTLLSTPMKNGNIMPDDDIVTMFMGLIFAGHETTAGQAAWTIALLLQHPEYLQLVQDEINEKVPYGKSIDAATLSQLDHTFWAIDETTRLRPSADVQVRTVDEPFEIDEYELPVGTQVILNSANSHFLPDVFENPNQFDPLRFSPERGEGKNPFAIVGFGGGIHKCTGMNFARNEMAIIVTRFLQQFDVTLLTDDIEVVTGNGANGPSEIMVRYHRKPLSDLTDEDTIREAVAAGCPHIENLVTD